MGIPLVSFLVQQELDAVGIRDDQILSTERLVVGQRGQLRVVELHDNEGLVRVRGIERGRLSRVDAERIGVGVSAARSEADATGLDEHREVTNQLLVNSSHDFKCGL